MEVLKAIAAFLAAHMTKIVGVSQTTVAAILGAAATKQIPDLVALDSPAFQWFVLANILLGGATIGVGFNNSARIKVATAIDNALQAHPSTEAGRFRAHRHAARCGDRGDGAARRLQGEPGDR